MSKMFAPLAAVLMLVELTAPAMAKSAKKPMLRAAAIPPCTSAQSSELSPEFKQRLLQMGWFAYAR